MSGGGGGCDWDKMARVVEWSECGLGRLCVTVVVSVKAKRCDRLKVDMGVYEAYL